MAATIDRTQLKFVIESVLFVADGPVDLRTLARLIEVPLDDITTAIGELAAESKSRGVRIQQTGQAVQLVSAPETAPFVQRYLGIDEHQRLSPVVLVTLTVIAYQQPVTKGEVERILKKNCDYSVAVLKARELIAEVGRTDGPGRPYLYGTTFKFLEHFGLERPEDLPPLPELAVAAVAAATTLEGEEDEEGLPTVEELLGSGEAEEEGLQPVEALLGEDDETPEEA